MKYAVFFVLLLCSCVVSAAAPILDIGVDTSTLTNANHATDKKHAGDTVKTRTFAVLNYVIPIRSGVFVSANLRASDVNYAKDRYKDYWLGGAGIALSKKFDGFEAPLITASLNVTQRNYDKARYPASKAYRGRINFDKRITDRLSSHVGMSYGYSENLPSSYKYSKAPTKNGNSIVFDLGLEHQLAHGSWYTEVSIALHDQISYEVDALGVIEGRLWEGVQRYNIQLGYNLPLTNALVADVLIEHSQATLDAQTNYYTTAVSLALIYRFSL